MPLEDTSKQDLYLEITSILNKIQFGSNFNLLNPQIFNKPIVNLGPTYFAQTELLKNPLETDTQQISVQQFNEQQLNLEKALEQNQDLQNLLQRIKQSLNLVLPFLALGGLSGISPSLIQVPTDKDTSETSKQDVKPLEKESAKQTNITTVEQELAAKNIKTDNEGRFKSKEEFLTKMYPLAVKASNRLGNVDPDTLLTQWGLESGWGSKVGGNYNYFGIKADKSWEGPSNQATTEEYDPNKGSYITKGSFRSYGSEEEAVDDYVNFLRSNPRYAKAGVFEAKDGGEYLEALQEQATQQTQIMQNK